MQHLNTLGGNGVKPYHKWYFCADYFVECGLSRQVCTQQIRNTHVLSIFYFFDQGEVPENFAPEKGGIQKFRPEKGGY